MGDPADIFITNASESLNAALKKKVNYKETERLQFNEAVKELILAQRDSDMSFIQLWKIQISYKFFSHSPELDQNDS